MEGHPLTTAAPAPRVSVCNAQSLGSPLLHWVFCTLLRLRTDSCLRPRAGSHHAPLRLDFVTHIRTGDIGISHFLWHYLWNKGETPALTCTLGMPPALARCCLERCWKARFPVRQLAFPALFGREGKKAWGSDFDSSYLQLRNRRAVKLISVLNQLVKFSPVGVKINVE